VKLWLRVWCLVFFFDSRCSCMTWCSVVCRCTVCDRAFSRSGILQNHMKVHTGEKAFECTVCNKRFSRSALLTWHSRIHTGVKPYQCTVCGKVQPTDLFMIHSDMIHETRFDSTFCCFGCERKIGLLASSWRVPLYSEWFFK